MSAEIHQWIDGIRVASNVADALLRLREADDVQHIAVMPDVHLASEFCVGTVIGTSRLIYPNAVGGDIGCGMAAVAFDCDAKVLGTPKRAAAVLAGLYKATPANRQHRLRKLPEQLVVQKLSDESLERIKHRDGVLKLGTLGSGNHFIELQRDDDARLWLMVHSGSRSMGQAIRDFHFKRATVGNNGLRWLDTETDEGRAYVSDAQWAVEYARANRRAMVEGVMMVLGEVVGADLIAESYFDCDHNHVRREMHFGKEFWVHRKGATPAQEGSAGIIPGSMGTWSYHTIGRGCEAALCSSSHGAGRAMGRSEARQRISKRDFVWQMGEVWFDHRLTSRITDEAPGAYKDIDRVMAAQEQLTHVARKLWPILSYKGG